MRNSSEDSIEMVIRAMHENVGETFTNDEMARSAMFSKFHFSRVFQDVTGVSPGRFLAALRIAEAKRLLLGTNLSVTDISVMVGYASVGTFSTRFKLSVGLSPSAFRASGGLLVSTHARQQGISSSNRRIDGFVTGCGFLTTGPILIGLFQDSIPQGRPERCTILHEPGQFTIEDVPVGRWHLLATARAEPSREPRQHSGDDAYTSWEQGCDLIGSAGPLDIVPGNDSEPFTIALRPPTPFDPPVLLAQPAPNLSPVGNPPVRSERLEVAFGRTAQATSHPVGRRPVVGVRHGSPTGTRAALSSNHSDARSALPGRGLEDHRAPRG